MYRNNIHVLRNTGDARTLQDECDFLNLPRVLTSWPISPSRAVALRIMINICRDSCLFHGFFIIRHLDVVHRPTQIQRCYALLGSRCRQTSEICNYNLPGGCKPHFLFIVYWANWPAACLAKMIFTRCQAMLPWQELRTRVREHGRTNE